MTSSAQSELPAEYDTAVYRRRYPDLSLLSDAELKIHFETAGFREGRNAAVVENRRQFFSLVPTKNRNLEIGPFANPMLRGENVRYFDVLTSEQLRSRAIAIKLDPEKCPTIHFVSPIGDLSVVNETFDAVASSHVIEHQVDLIGHLCGVARLLKGSGRYYLVIPDKRYCFDHFISESTVAEVVAGTVRASSLHDIQSIIEHAALTTHNDAARHWAGDHGSPIFHQRPEAIREAVKRYLSASKTYIDVHAWQFVPQSFRTIIDTLLALSWSPFQVERIYPTSSGSNEFYAVLKLTNQACESVMSRGLPTDFNVGDYLIANPDVAKAGCDAAQHYLEFGRREGRKLR